MSRPSAIDAVRNRKTQKLFIVVDDSLDMRYKVINPAGEVLILPDLLFDEDPLQVPVDQYGVEFTQEQLEAYDKFQERAEIEAKALADRPPPPPRKIVVEAKRPPAKKREPKIPERRGLGASWVAPRLSFYKHKIEPLHPKQTFRVQVEGFGTFEISKEEFLAQFNDVVMSKSYIADGLYTYTQLPEKAKRYLKA